MVPAASIKKTIEFNKSFRSLLEVIKLLSVSQYHVLEKKLKTFEQLEKVFGDFFESIDTRSIQHPFLDPGDRPSGVLAVTSDAGLLGGLNMQVVSKAVELLREGQGKLVIVGEKGRVYAQDMGLPFVYFPGVADEKKAAQACELRDYLTKQVLQGAIGSVKIVYPKAVSVVVQRVEVATLIPFIKPQESAEPRLPDGQALTPLQETIMESKAEAVLEYLVYLFLGQRICEIFGMSRLAEQAARFVHLEESCQRISKMNDKLLLQYFRRRHEAIDQNMRELFAARSLYAK